MTLDGVGAEALSRSDCLRLLDTAPWGRVAISIGALPSILPVQFALEGESIVFRAAPGGALDAATRGTVVAFEADGVQPELGPWSVLVVGTARHLTRDEDLARLQHLALRAWSTTCPDRFVTLSPEVVSGRRLHESAL